MKYYQQGDVLLKKISQLPDGAKVKTGRDAYVVQEGESTGHAHRFPEGGDGGNVTLYTVGNVTYVQVREAPAPISHEEHNTIQIAPGLYEIDLVREYDYNRNEVRRVVD